MRQTNDGLSAFGHRFPFQIDHAELGDHIHDVGARGSHDVTGREGKHDAAAALASFLVGGRKTDKRLASLGGIGAAHELQLSSRAADVAVTVRLRSRLPLQINLRGVVDRNHLVVLHDDVRRVGVVHLVAVPVRIAVRGGVERL